MEMICLRFQKSRNLRLIAYYKFRIKKETTKMLKDKVNPEVPESGTSLSIAPKVELNQWT